MKISLIPTLGGLEKLRNFCKPFEFFDIPILGLNENKNFEDFLDIKENKEELRDILLKEDERDEQQIIQDWRQGKLPEFYLIEKNKKNIYKLRMKYHDVYFVHKNEMHCVEVKTMTKTDYALQCVKDKLLEQKSYKNKMLYVVVFLKEDNKLKLLTVDFVDNFIENFHF